MLESGTAIDDLSPAAKEKANKYFTVKRWGGKITATANNKAIKDANKYHGYFALVSNKEKDPSLKQRNSMSTAPGQEYGTQTL